MISILIPTYNYAISTLVNEIHKQAMHLKIVFEIIVLDDASTNNRIIEQNKTITKYKNCSFIELKENIGRSKIRNLLAKKANYDWLLFLDADVEVFRSNFIKNYLNHINDNTQIIYGGIQYQLNTPSSNEILRWKYGNSREALTVTQRNKLPHLSFLTLNFLIHKSVFKIISFNESIPNLRHEDTLFALDLKKKLILVEHIDNPIIHLGLESSATFLKKSEEAVDAIILFEKQHLIDPNDVKITRNAQKLKSLGFLIIAFFKFFKNVMKQNLLSKDPSLFIFDLYRLGYLFTSKKQSNA